MLMCCLSCAKVDWCKQADRVEDFCINHEERPMTNADKFRARCGAEEGEITEDYIKRKAVLDLVDSGKLISNDNYDKVRRMIEDIPAEDVVPRTNEEVKTD